MWDFKYFGYHYSTQKLSCQKLWHLSFQTPYRTCHYEVWVCFCILVKFEDFFIILNEKVIFSQFRWNIKKTMNIEWNVTFYLGWLYEWLTRRWKAQNLYFSNKLFLGTIGYHVCLQCDICTIHWYVFLFKIQWIRRVLG